MEQKNVKFGRRVLNKKWAALSKKSRESLAECRRLIEFVKNYPLGGAQ